MFRTWMVTTGKYAFITQRMKPKMSLIVPSVNGSNLEINAPEMETLRLPISPDINAYEKVDSAYVQRDKVTISDEYILFSNTPLFLKRFIPQLVIHFI